MDESNIHLSCVFCVFFFSCRGDTNGFSPGFPPHMDSAMRPLNISMFAKKRNYLLVGLTRPEWHFQRLNSNGVNVLKSNHGESNYTHAKAEPNTSSNKTRSHIIILLSAV